MKQQPRPKHTLQTDSDRFPSKFSEAQKTNPTMMSYDAAKHTIDFSDSIPSSHKVNMPPHFMNFLKNSTSNHAKLSRNDKASRTETGAPETESSIQYESKRMSYPLKADPNISFTKPQIKKRTSSKGSNLNRSLVQESSKTHDKHERSISPVLKNLDLPRNNMCFQTYDPENMPTKKRPTSTKPTRKEAPGPAPVKAQAQFKRKAKSALRGSKVQNSIDFSKMIHQPLYEELYESLKPNAPGPASKHMRKKSSFDVPPQPTKARRSSSISGNIKPGKKRNSQPNIGEYNDFTTEGTISHVEGPYQLDNYLNVATTVDKRVPNLPDPQDLTEKEMYEMHANLSSYYDLLVQRDEANSRLLQNLKGNFHSLMGEFMKNYQIIRQYNGFNPFLCLKGISFFFEPSEYWQNTSFVLFSDFSKKIGEKKKETFLWERVKEQYEIEREKSQKEKDLLKLQLEMLKNENSKLKNLNMKYIQSDVNQSFSHPSQSHPQNPFLVSQDIQQTIYEERKLMELLDQREKFISFMKEKENKYIALLNAIEAKGINVDRIYEQDVGKAKQTEHTFETGESISEIVLTNIDDNYIRIAKPLKTLPTESSQGEVGQDLFNFAKRMQGLKKIQKKGSSNKQSRAEYHNWAERQITEASLSKTESPYSQSLFSSYNHHNYPVKQEKSLNKLIDDFPIQQLMQRKKTAGTAGTNSYANIQEGGNEEPSVDIKDKLKLDLSTLQQKVIKQYHDEFMEKWAEFTSSWKRAMKNDKTFQEVLNK